MGYAVRADLASRFGEDEIAQRESMLPAGATDQALADAAAEIDSYVSGRYVVPLSPLPANILKIACQIARYNLMGDSVTERARNDYQDARAFLRDVQSGKALLELATPLTGGTPANTVQISSSTRVFAREARDL